jgi:1-acyl-sn-glycerol-3-phosphate acyltransferase
VVYPEGTLTRDPDLWPMKGKSGAARIALATGCPVIPVGQWGAQQLLAPYSKKPHLVPRKHIIMKAGDPVPLADLVGKQHTAEVITEATDRIMTALTDVVADIRGEAAPVERFDVRRHGVKETGNPQGDARKARRRSSR